MKKTSFLLIIGILFLVLIGSYGGYKFWGKASLEAELKRVERNLASFKQEVANYEHQQVVQAISAKKTVEIVKDDLIKWSEVIEIIRRTLPTTTRGVALVEVLSYSGSSSQNISMNMKTLDNRLNPYFDVADLIESFEGSEFFIDNFVPSISTTQNERGETILSFLLQTKYEEEDDLLESFLREEKLTREVIEEDEEEEIEED